MWLDKHCKDTFQENLQYTNYQFQNKCEISDKNIIVL